jgi:hypothetical protein
MSAILLLCALAPFEAWAADRPTAREAVEAMGKGFNLGQMFDNTQHPPTLEAAGPKIDAYYERGFRLVRIPVTWTEPIDGATLADPDTGRLDRTSPRLAQLEAVIDYALSRPGLYVVINAHHESGLKDHARADVLEQLWTDIGTTFQDRDGRLIFEILNEPHLSNHEPMPPETLRAMTGRAYERIRRIDPERIVVIGGSGRRKWPRLGRTWTLWGGATTPTSWRPSTITIPGPSPATTRATTPILGPTTTSSARCGSWRTGPLRPAAACRSSSANGASAGKAGTRP